MDTPIKTTTSDSSNLMRSEAELVLELARADKAKRIKDLGSPIETPGKALDIKIIGNYAWIAENTSLIRKLDLETGKTMFTLKGHSAPATCLAFFDKHDGSETKELLFTGSWDKTINVWDLKTRKLISSTPAHADFVKSLLVIPSLNLLVSGSSDKIVRFWDLSTCQDENGLKSAGSISAHTRPVECLDGYATSDSTGILYTADTMGVIKVWELSRDNETPPRWRATLKDELQHHRTRINEILYGNGQLWTASSDDTAQAKFQPHLLPTTKPVPPLTHPTAVRAILPLALTPLAEPYVLTGAGDIIRAYDVSSPDEPELLNSLDAHWHDITALRLWVRKATNAEGKGTVEPWIVSASLDGTIRKWRLSDLLTPQTSKPVVAAPPPPAKPPKTPQLSEEEERELAELMGDDDA